MFNTTDSGPRTEGPMIASGKKALHRVKKLLDKVRRAKKFQARLKLIHFAAGDVARKYMPFHPFFRQPGDEGYDPYVDQMTRASLRRETPLPHVQEQLRQERARTIYSGPTEQKVRPGKAIRADISHQQRDLKVGDKPKRPWEVKGKEEPIEVEGLGPQKGKTLHGPLYESWKPENVVESGIKFTPDPSMVVGRTKLPQTIEEKLAHQERVSRRGEAFRDPMAVHKAQVAAGVRPSAIATREEKTPEGGWMEHVKGTPKTYLPQAEDVLARKEAQGYRGILAASLRKYRREVLQPVRARQRVLEGRPALQPIDVEKKIWPKAEAMGYAEIARGHKIQGWKPGQMIKIGGTNVYPPALAAAHEKIKSQVASVVKEHAEHATSIRNILREDAYQNLAKSQRGPAAMKSAESLIGDVFQSGQSRGHSRILQPSNLKIEQIAGHTGRTPTQIRRLHRVFRNATYYGETGAGEADLLKSAVRKAWTVGAPSGGGPVAHSYPALKRLGLGLGAAGVAGGAAYAGYRLLRRTKKEQQMSARLKEIRFERGKFWLRHMTRQGELTGTPFTTSQIRGNLLEALIRKDPSLMAKHVPGASPGKIEEVMKYGRKSLAEAFWRHKPRGRRFRSRMKEIRFAAGKFYGRLIGVPKNPVARAALRKDPEAVREALANALVIRPKGRTMDVPITNVADWRKKHELVGAKLPSVKAQFEKHMANIPMSEAKQKMAEIREGQADELRARKRDLVKIAKWVNPNIRKVERAKAYGSFRKRLLEADIEIEKTKSDAFRAQTAATAAERRRADTAIREAREGFEKERAGFGDAMREEQDRRFRGTIAAAAGGAGVGAGVGYLLPRRGRRQNGERRFAIPRALKKELIIGSALTGGITAADAATSYVNPDPDKTRAKSAWAGAKRGLLYGSVLSATEPVLTQAIRRAMRTRKLSSRLKEIRFKKNDDDSDQVGETAGKSVEHAEDLLPERALEHLPGHRRLLLGGTILAGAKAVNQGVANFLRGFKPKQNYVQQAMSSLYPEIRFQYPEFSDYPDRYPTKRRRLTVAQDRYRKLIRGQEISRKENNLAKAAIAGGALAAAVHGKAGIALKPAIAIGGAAGLGTEAALIHRGKKSRDPYGEESITSKRVEKLPWQVGGLAAGGVAAHTLWKHKGKIGSEAAKWLLSSRLRTIRFQDQEQEIWGSKRLERAIKYPASRADWAYTTGKRAKRLFRDIEAPKTAGGKIIDPRGRTREPEWQKEWFKRAAITGAATGGLWLLGKGYHGTRRAAAEGIEVARMGGKPTQWQRTAGDLMSGNVWRAAKSYFPKMPKVSAGLGQVGSELREIRDRALGTFNKGVEAKTGSILPGRHAPKKGPGGEYKSVKVINPAHIAEEQEKSRAAEEKLRGQITEQQKYRDRLNKQMADREKIKKAMGEPKPGEEWKWKPPESLSSKLKLIRFQAPVYVPPHFRKPRRQKTPVEKKRFRETALVLAGLLGSAGAATWGLRRASGAKLAEEEFMRSVKENARRQVAAQAPSGVEGLRRKGLFNLQVK